MTVFLDLRAAASIRKEAAGIKDFDLACHCPQLGRPIGGWAAKQQRALEWLRYVAEPIETFLKGPIEQEKLRTRTGGPVTPERAQVAIKQLCHASACAAATVARQGTV